MTTAAAAQTAAPGQETRPHRPDFPTWLPAVLVKELRQGLRTRGFVAALVVFQLIMVLMMVTALVSMKSTIPAARAGVFQTINQMFWIALTAQLLIVTPLRALGALRAELDARSLELLMLTRLSAWRVVLGKWVSLLAQSALLFSAMLPYGVVRYFGGSVDLVDDAMYCGMLMGFSALLTAAALCASGMPRALQIIVPVVLVATLQLGVVSSRGRGPTVPGDSVMLWVQGVMITIYLLLSAVRQIAPPSENHSAMARCIPLASLLLVPISRIWAMDTAVRVHFVIGVLFLAVACAVELAQVRTLMPAHWEPWHGRGVIEKLFGRMLLPGWQSAVIATLVSAALAALTLALVPAYRGFDTSRFLSVVPLGAAALVFPTVLMQLIPAKWAKLPAAVYFLVFAGLSLVAVMVAVTKPDAGYEVLARMLPVSSFWLSFDPHTSLFAAQFGVAVLVFVLAFLKSKPYWRQLAAIDKRPVDE